MGSAGKGPVVLADMRSRERNKVDTLSPLGASGKTTWAIETDRVTRRFGDLVAVDGLSLRVGHGEILGIVGPDGAGKTTVLRLLAGIMNPTSGRATVLGYDSIRQAGALKHHIGYMAQRFSLYGDLNVDENLGFFADVFGVKGAARRERVERLLRFARLTEFHKRRAGRLSGGMQKKLALACTLVHTPDLVLLDEPTTGVDPVSRREFWDILSQLHLEGVTLVVSTPYMDEAERCTRVGLMYQGSLVVCDTPDRIKAMTEGEMVAVTPSDVRAARDVLSRAEGLLEVQTYGDQLRVFAEDADVATHLVRETLAGAGVDVIDLRHSRPTMEEAFVSLIRRRGDIERSEGQG